MDNGDFVCWSVVVVKVWIGGDFLGICGLFIVEWVGFDVFFWKF